MSTKYSIGLDFGTNSVRVVVVNAANGNVVGTAVCGYSHGTEGVILSSDPNLARQHPGDYLSSMEVSVRGALAAASKKAKGFRASDVIGIGVDTTGSTPLPVDCNGRPLAFDRRFAEELAALAWLWKDHTSVAEAEEITTLAARIRPQYLAKCGRRYSSEWFFSKILHCLRTSPQVFRAAHTWVEIADWIPAVLTGNEAPGKLRVGICAAGHKAMYNRAWGGYPDEKFLGSLDPELAELRRRLALKAYTVNTAAGLLTKEWASRLRLPAGIPVAVGAFDAHLGAVGSGIRPGTMVKIIGTSTCDMMVVPEGHELADIPGLCGIVPGSILPGCFGLEAGQSAVGDIFNWFVGCVRPEVCMGAENPHTVLENLAARLRPGQSGLLALDWNNGNRTVLVDQRLTGLLLGQTLYTTPAEIYRALVEATAFGALTIINRFEEYGVKVREIVNCGGIAERSPFVMQVYADVTGRPMKISRSPQTCALGAAIAGAVVAGRKSGGYGSVEAAMQKMTGTKRKVFVPNPEAHRTYKMLFPLYRQLHDAFGNTGWKGSLDNVMKKLIEIRDHARSGG